MWSSSIPISVFHGPHWVQHETPQGVRKVRLRSPSSHSHIDTCISSTFRGFVTELTQFFFKDAKILLFPPPHEITHQHGSLLEGLGKLLCLRIEGKHYSVSGRKGLWVIHHFLLPTPQGKQLVLLTTFERLIFKKLIKMTVSLSRSY